MSIILIRSFYNLGLLLLLILGSPWWLLRYATSERFRAGLGERFFGPSKTFVGALPGGPRIWIHAVSVGEVLAVSDLVRQLQEKSPQLSIVISMTTRTGHALARERFGAQHCFYFPLDFPWSIAAVLRRLQPSILVLAESELWPNLLTHCRRHKIPVVVVNARVSDRSLPRYRKLRIMWQPFLKLLSLVLAQTAEDARRFAEIGVPAERISIGGNLKFDIRAPGDSHLTTLLKIHMQPEAKVLVCGSTLEGEEPMLLDAWHAIRTSLPDAVMILAPRHPERFEKVADLVTTSGFGSAKRSAWINDPANIAPGSVFLLDSIGELASLYSLATVAFIGGSLIPSGGHNPLEPAQFGRAITIGSHYENFRSIVELLVAQQAIAIVPLESLAQVLTNLLRDQASSTQLGIHALRVFEEQSGATARAADAILQLLNAGGNA